MAKRDELRMAQRDRSPFSMASPHLPLAGMAVNDHKFPIQPSFIKMRKEENAQAFDRFNGFAEDEESKDGLGL